LKARFTNTEEHKLSTISYLESLLKSYFPFTLFAELDGSLVDKKRICNSSTAPVRQRVDELYPLDNLGGFGSTYGVIYLDTTIHPLNNCVTPQGLRMVL